MSVRIRLRRVGRKKQPSYRVVIADRAAARDGAYIEAIGFYNPRANPAQLRLDLERVDYWLGQGAEPSTTVHDLILKARKGGDAKVGLVAAQPEPAAAETAPKRGRGSRPAGTAEPTPETEAKATPESGSEAIEGAEPAKQAAPKPGSRGRGRGDGGASAEGAAAAGPATGGDSADGEASAGTEEIGGSDAAQQAAATAATPGAETEVAAAEAAAESGASEEQAEEPLAEEEQEKE